jgi:EpsI family protein
MACGCRMSESESPLISGPSTRALNGAGRLSSPVVRGNKDTALRFLALCAPVFAVILLCWPTVLGMVSIWNDTENRGYTHGWLIAFVTGWLMWQLARDLPVLRMSPRWVTIPGLLVLSLTWLVLFRTSIQVGQILLLPLMMWLAVTALYGTFIARRSIFPLAYLYFATPLLGYLVPALQWGTVFANRFFIRLCGIPASFDANTVRVPSGVFEIQGGCAGGHFFIVALALATLYAHLQRTAAWGRLLVLAGSLAILANWIRVFTIVVAGYLTNMQHYLVTVDHYWFGWGVFALTMVVFFIVAARFSELPASQSGREEQPILPVLSPLQLTTAIVATLAALAAGPLAEQVLASRAGAPLSAHLLPSSVSGWQATAVNSFTDWRPTFGGADNKELGRYTQNDRVVEIFSAEYRDQNQNKKLAGYYNSVVGDEQTNEVESPPVDLPAGFAQHALVDQQGRQALIWHSYYVGERRFASALKAQIYYGLKSLVSQPVSGVIAMRTSCETDCTNATRILERFAAQTHPAAVTR